jgi:predicted nucleic acid-binding protein
MSRIATLPAATDIFIDSNIFVLATHATGPLGQACKALLERVRHGELQGYTSTLVTAEVIHRFLVKEAQDQMGFASSRETVEHLQQHPETVRRFRQHIGVASEMRQMQVDILPVTVKDLHASKAARADHGLLANDSLIVGVMRGRKLRHLATHDSGFLRVPSLAVWMPGT